MTDVAINAILSHIKTARARFAASDFRDEVGCKARDFLADSLAVGVAGGREPAAAQVRQAAQRWGAGSDAAVLGQELRLPVASAAFCNAFQIHCQEFDCLHEEATVHAMAVLGGCLTALAATSNLRYGDALLGTIIGVDVAAGLGVAATQGLIFFRPATAGAMGSASAIAAILNMNESKTRNFLGLVYSQLSGTMQAHVEGSVALPLQIAVAARAVMTALDLVQFGLTGPINALSGPFGYFQLFEPGGDPNVFLAGLRGPSRVCELSHKPFPTGRAAHAILNGIETLMHDHCLTASDIQWVDAEIPPLIRRLVDRPITPMMSRNYARLCIYFLAALMVRDGEITGESLNDKNRGDAALAQLGKKMRLHDNGVTDPNALAPQTVTITTHGGDRHSLEIPATLGHPDNPLTDEQKQTKIARCLEVASPAAAEQLIDASASTPLSEIIAKLGPLREA